MKPILFPAGQTSFQSEPTVAQLRSAAESYIRNNDVGSPKVSLDFSFVVSVLSNTIQFLAYLAVLIYALYTNRIKGEAPFQGIVLAFAALLGIQLLQSGQAITGYGLSETLTLMINTFNLIAFANVIMFSCKLNEKKTAVGYLTMAVILKLIGELILIIKLWTYINFGIILISLSVPVLGIVILLAYLMHCHEKD